MTSLVPGPLFCTPGLNRNSTPTPTNTTPRELDSKYERGDFNGHPWPHDSPVNRVYDVQNTSTKLIILNNRYGQNGTRLRGYYSGPGVNKSDRIVNPRRHERVTSPVNMDLHGRCLESSSPRFEPSVKANIEWTNQTQRPANSLTVKSTVNPKRHAGCQVPRDPIPYNSDSRPVSRMSHPPKRYFTDFPELTVGEKIYLWSIEKIYNIDHLKKQKEDQYRKLLDQEARKGYHGFEEYAKYMRYIHSASKRTYGMASPGIHRSGVSRSTTPRTRSAFSHRSSGDANSKTTSKSGSVKDGETEKSPVRPHTSIVRTRSPAATKTKRALSAKSDGSKPTKSESKQTTKSSNQRSPYLPARPKSVPVLKLRSKPSRLTSTKQAKKISKMDDNSETSSLTDKGETTPSLHKEGVDRPKSRLGHVPPKDDKEKDTVVRKPDIKYDEYSDDSDHEPDDTVTTEGKVDDDREDTRETDQKAQDKKPTASDEHDHSADETASERKPADSSTNGQVLEPVNDEATHDKTETKSRDILPFIRLDNGKEGNVTTETEISEKMLDNDRKIEASSVNSLSSLSKSSTDETQRRDRQEHVEITTKKRQSVNTNNESEGTTDVHNNTTGTTADKNTKENGRSVDNHKSDKSKDSPVFITEPPNSTPRKTQVNDEAVTNDGSNNKLVSETVGQKSDSEPRKESVQDGTNKKMKSDRGSSGKGRLARQDSLDEDDEERRASKDIDNIEY